MKTHKIYCKCKKKSIDTDVYLNIFILYFKEKMPLSNPCDIVQKQKIKNHINKFKVESGSL